jgi:hypothetical protein
MRLVNLQEKTGNFKFYQFDSLLASDVLGSAIVESKSYTPFKIEKTRTSNTSRLWMNQLDTTVFYQIAELFEMAETKKMFSDVTGVDLLNMRTRAELCIDKAGSWLEPHVDDPAKTFTLQLYLSGNGTSTIMGTTATDINVGSGWFFANTASEWHHLSPLLHDRNSIIINYVNSKWNDETVLV